MAIILEIQYLPPIQYFSKFIHSDGIIIDDSEGFQKQSYRNRCRIIGANNIQELIIPLKSGKTHLKIRDVQIDNTRRWQKEHWHSIKSAYGKAPFFEHYAPYFKPLYEKEFTSLFEFDLTLLRLSMKILKINESKLGMLSELSGEGKATDFRNSIHPKKKYQADDPAFSSTPYGQAFSERHGFIPNLSIIDLIFNAGSMSAI